MDTQLIHSPLFKFYRAILTNIKHSENEQVNDTEFLSTQVDISIWRQQFRIQLYKPDYTIHIEGERHRTKILNPPKNLSSYIQYNKTIFYESSQEQIYHVIKTLFKLQKDEKRDLGLL